MATSTLRAAIIVAALVLGGIVLANAFPGTVVQGPSNVPTTSSPTTSSPPVSPTPSLVPLSGVVLQVLNGTTTTGLAGEVAQCLVDAAGAVVPDDNIANAPEDNYTQTNLVHRPDSNAVAQTLRTRFFPGAKIVRGEPLPGKPDVQVTVIVGADYVPVAECGAAPQG